MSTTGFGVPSVEAAVPLAPSAAELERARVAQLSVKLLKEELSARAVNIVGLAEKGDLVEALLAAPPLLSPMAGKKRPRAAKPSASASASTPSFSSSSSSSSSSSMTTFAWAYYENSREGTNAASGTFRAPYASVPEWLLGVGRGMFQGDACGLQNGEDALTAQYVDDSGDVVDGPPLDESCRAFVTYAGEFCEVDSGGASKPLFAALAAGQSLAAVAALAQYDGGEEPGIDVLSASAVVFKAFEDSDGGIRMAYGVGTGGAAALAQLVCQSCDEPDFNSDGDEGEGRFAYGGAAPRESAASKLKCFTCGAKGHFAASCPRKISGPPCTKCGGATEQRTSASEANPGRL